MKETQPADRPHAKHSPSSLHYKEICPRFENRKESSVASVEGHRLHLALETGNIDGLDDEQMQVVGMCRGYAEELEREARTHGNIAVHREVQLKIANGLTFGTADYIAITRGGRIAELVDFKFGRNSVPDAEINPQMQAYALGVFERFPEIESVRVHILLPRRDEVSVAKYDRSDVPRLRLRIQTVIARLRLTLPKLDRRKTASGAPVRRPARRSIAMRLRSRRVTERSCSFRMSSIPATSSIPPLWRGRSSWPVSWRNGVIR